MKAILFHHHGSPEVLKFTDFPDPVPEPGEVLVRLKAASLNRMDLWVREGWQGLELEYPHIPGADGAGEVYQVGEGVDEWSVGDEVVINPNLGCGNCDFCQAGKDNMCRNWHVFGETVRGTHTEFVVVPERQLLRLPEGFDHIIAAGGALVFQTAWHSLISNGRLRPGENVLIVGSSGGVNTACIQIAKYSGATVFVVGSGQSKLELAESLGADYLIDLRMRIGRKQFII